MDRVTDRMYIADVGGNVPSTSTEEVNLGIRGAYYGWPQCDGTCGVPGATNPIFSYPHAGRDASITGGVVYRGSQFPSEYYGSYFFGDYVQNTIRRLKFDANGNVSDVMNFWPANGAKDTDACRRSGEVPAKGPTGRSTTLTSASTTPCAQPGSNTTDSLHRRQPAADCRSECKSHDGAGASACHVLQHRVFGSRRRASTYSWTFGDGGTSTQANPTHTYRRTGQYTARPHGLRR